jgi:proline iminopeptidase
MGDLHARPRVVEEGLRNVNGTRLYCKVVGRGDPILILHGGPGLDHRYFLPQMKGLAVGHRLIFFDQRASGQSSAAVDSASLTMRTLVEDLDGVRKAFGLGRMNLMGHSWGGLVAMFYAIRYPEQLRSLILVNPTPASSALRREAFRAMSSRTTPEDSAAMAAIRSSREFFRREPAIMARFFRHLFRGTFHTRRFADSLTLQFDPDYGEKNRLLQYLNNDPVLQSFDLHRELERIACPTLIIGAEYDQSPPVAIEMIRAHIRNSQLVVLRNCGHFPFVERPGEFFEIVEGFLRGVGT